MTAAKGKEKKVKGCIQSENGSYVLQAEHGKVYNLSGGTDLAGHVGHEVKVHGTLSDSSAVSSPSSSAASAGSTSQGTLTVSSIEMVSDTCKMAGKHEKGEKSDKTAPPTQ